MKYYTKIILLLIFTNCKNNDALESIKIIESKTSIPDSSKENNSPNFYQKNFSYLFEYSEENSNQLLGINIIDEKTIQFHLVTETLPCDTEYWGIAVNKFWDGDKEIEEDYFVDEYFKEEKEYFVGIRIAEDLSKVKINYIQKDSLNTDCLPITEKTMNRIPTK